MEALRALGLVISPSTQAGKQVLGGTRSKQTKGELFVSQTALVISSRLQGYLN